MEQNYFDKLYYYLTYANNDCFRSVLNTSNGAYLHDNQIETAKQIVLSFNEMKTRRNHIMLIAKMQSGKTGVCNATVNIINKTKLDSHMGINKFLFVTGMNDCGLKNQTFERLLEQVSDANEHNTFRRKSSESMNKKYYVLKNSDLLKYEGNLDNSLIFIDESHYGSKEKNILTQFLYKHGVNWRDETTLVERNIYIVSVSATPFDELVSDKVQCKKMVELKTDSSYVGVSDYVNKGLVHCGNFTDKCGEVIECLIDAKNRMDRDDCAGIAFVRIRDFNEIESDEYVKTHFDIYEMYANGSKIAYDKLTLRIEDLIRKNKTNKSLFKGCKFFGVEEKKAVKPLLVLIKGAFRAGITINTEFKDYIYMVYDYSAKAASTAQALLGRMCGYRSSDNEIKTEFYINDRMANMYAKWEQNFSNRQNIPCDKVTYQWVDADYDGDEETEIASRSCGNFAIDLTDEEIKLIYTNGKAKKTRAKFVEKLIPRLFEEKEIDIPYDYIMENAISGKNNYKISSQIKRFDSFSESSMVYQFRPEKIKKFIEDTGRDYLEHEDIGKRCISIVLDAEIYDGGNTIGGNKRLLVYYVEVGQRIYIPNQDAMYSPHKDTSIKK